MTTYRTRTPTETTMDHEHPPATLPFKVITYGEGTVTNPEDEPKDKVG